MAVKKSKAKRKVAGRASVAKSASKKVPSVKDPLSKGGIIKTITDTTLVQKRDVVAVLDCLHQIIEKHIKGGPGTFVMSGLLKISVVKKPAKPARKGINPFTGEEMTFKAKPARKVVKIRPLKKLKEMVA